MQNRHLQFHTKYRRAFLTNSRRPTPKIELPNHQDGIPLQGFLVHWEKELSSQIQEFSLCGLLAKKIQGLCTLPSTTKVKAKNSLPQPRVYPHLVNRWRVSSLDTSSRSCFLKKQVCVDRIGNQYHSRTGPLPGSYFSSKIRKEDSIP